MFFELFYFDGGGFIASITNRIALNVAQNRYFSMRCIYTLNSEKLYHQAV